MFAFFGLAQDRFSNTFRHTPPSRALASLLPSNDLEDVWESYSPGSPGHTFFQKGINPYIGQANTEIDEEYTLDGEVQKGGMSIIRFGLSSVGERVVIKFCGEQASYEREVSSLQRIQGLGPSVNTSNIIRMIDYIDPEEKDDWYPYSVVVLECGDMSLLSWAASSNRRPVEKNYLKMVIM
ncbi:MAG: hypothetical protein DHS80DRAFT_30158, partial [Piptocephalis tieghemiana]